MRLSIFAGEDEYPLPLETEADLPHDLIAEDRNYTVRLFATDEKVEMAGCHLFLGDVDMGAGQYEHAGQLAWTWDVTDYAGEVTLAVERCGLTAPLIEPREIMVDPNRNKLTRDQFAAMVNDINAQAAIAYSLSPATQRVALGQRHQALSLAQLEYMRQKMLPLRRAIEAIAGRPRRVLVYEDQVLDLALAQSSNDQSMTWLLGHPANLVALPDPSAVPPGARALHGRLKGHVPLRLLVGRRRVTHRRLREPPGQTLPAAPECHPAPHPGTPVSEHSGQ